jgi:hypothetical protein
MLLPPATKRHAGRERLIGQFRTWGVWQECTRWNQILILVCDLVNPLLLPRVAISAGNCHLYKVF